MARSKYRTFQRIHMQGNLVKTTARTGNISDYVLKASTERTPYLLSTYKRYVALNAERSSVVQRVTGKYKEKYGNAVYVMANEISKKETEILNKAAKQLGIYSGDELIRLLNYSKNNEGNKTMKQVIDGITGDFQEVFRYFQVGDYKSLSKDVAESFGAPKNDIDFGEFGAGGGTPKYRTDTPDLNKFMASFDKMLDILSSPDMFTADLLALEITLSTMHETLLRTRNKLGKTNEEIVVNDSVYSNMLGKLNSVKTKLEADLERSFGKTIVLNYKKSHYGAGFMTEIITNQLLGEGLKALDKKSNSVNTNNVKAIDKALTELATDSINVFGVGGQSRKMKTADTVISIKGKEELKLGVDIKWSGKKTMEKYGANTMYQAPTPINFGEELINLMKDNSSDSLTRLYRALVLNITSETGYQIGVQERTMLLAYKMSKKENFDHKFLMSGDTYPILVVSNGTVVRFSEAVRAMGTALVTTDMDQMAKGSWGNRFEAFGPVDQKSLYREKIKIGKGKTRTGFSERVPGALSLARSIEDSYKELGTKRIMLRFKIK